MKFIVFLYIIYIYDLPRHLSCFCKSFVFVYFQPTFKLFLVHRVETE